MYSIDMGSKKTEITIPTNERLLTILEVGARLGVSRDTVHRRIDDGLLERVYLSPKTPRITGSSLEQFLGALREGREPPKYQAHKNNVPRAEKPKEQDKSGALGKVKGWLGL